MWSEGIIKCPTTGIQYKFWVKQFEEGSEFGIDGGKISKLTIRKVGESNDLCNFDRGWDNEPTDTIETIYESIIAKYN